MDGLLEKLLQQSKGLKSLVLEGFKGYGKVIEFAKVDLQTAALLAVWLIGFDPSLDQKFEEIIQSYRILLNS